MNATPASDAHSKSDTQPPAASADDAVTLEEMFDAWARAECASDATKQPATTRRTAES